MTAPRTHAEINQLLDRIAPDVAAAVITTVYGWTDAPGPVTWERTARGDYHLLCGGYAGTIQPASGTITLDRYGRKFTNTLPLDLFLD